MYIADVNFLNAYIIRNYVYSMRMHIYMKLMNGQRQL